MSAPAPSWADVLALVAQLDASGLADAEIVADGVSVRVSRTVLERPAPGPAPIAPVGPAPVVPAPAVPAPGGSAAAEPGAVTGPVITAPVLGVVYHRPAPDRPPFVQVGDVVTPETTVAVIEVMKLMNPVRAGVRGVVRQVCVPDGATVEHGDVLFLLEERPDDRPEG